MGGRYPALFVGHGAPSLAIEDNATTHFFASWPQGFPAPQAVLVVSAHWDSGNELRVMAWDRASILHDFYGFPEEIYRLDYPASGSPAMARIIGDRLGEAGFEGVTVEKTRGLDHGAWVPLRLMYPGAECPVLQLSLPTAWPPRRLYALGRALSALREEGVLLIGSGAAVHNLNGLDPDPAAPVRDWASVFEDWLRKQMTAWNTGHLFDYWRMAPHGAQAHPSDEHLLPLFVAMGAGDTGRHAEIVHEGFMYGSLSMLAVQFA